MTLQYSLDAARFDTLLAEAQRRIIARSRDWTLHGPVDPGITILELYAALLEQRSFLADQVGDSLGRALLRLLGDAPRPAQVARTVLALEPSAPRVVPARTRMRPDRAQLERIFTTDRAVAVAPFAGFELHTAEGTRGELRQPAALLPAHGGAARAVIALRYDQPLPGGEWTGLLLELETGVAPEWSAAAASVPPPAKLRFGWRRAGVDHWFAPGELHDGTGGLRRSGIVHVRAPAAWGQPAGAHHEHALVIETDAATFTAPPRLVQLAPNAVIARHRHRRAHDARPDELAPISGQVLQLPLDEGLPLEDRVRLRLRERDGVARTWRPTFELGRHGPEDRVFVVDRARGLLRFGDGERGRAPYPATGAAARVAFEVGGGEAGNIGGLVRWTGTSGGEPLVGRNVVPAIDGADPERLDEARARFAGERTRPTRAVTRLDHEALAIATPGVAIARAHAAIGADPACPTRRGPGVATVYVVPAVVARGDEEIRQGRAIAAPRADEGALAAVRRTFMETRLVAHVVHVATAPYRPVRVEVTVESDPHDAAALRAEVAGALRLHLDPLRGGSAGTGWGFGAPLMPSDLLRVAQRALDESGDGGVVARVRVALDDEPLDACSNRDIADHELVVVQELRVLIRRPGDAA